VVVEFKGYENTEEKINSSRDIMKEVMEMGSGKVRLERGK
jgi:hypothetical protein